jgi:hypothetical protein
MMGNDGPHEDFVQEAVEEAPANDGMEGFVITSEASNRPSAEIGECQHPPALVHPSDLLETPARVNMAPAVASREPYGSPTALEYAFQTPLPTVTPPAHALTRSLGAPAPHKGDIKQVTPDPNDNYVPGQDEGFDDMQVRFLHDLQAVKDKHLDNEEQMMEMEVYLDHVISAINMQIIQMQEIHDELDEIDDTQEAIVAMHHE